MRVVWNPAPAVAGHPWPAFVDDAIAYFAAHAAAEAPNVAEFVKSADPEEEGVIVRVVDPFRPGHEHRVFIKYLEDTHPPATRDVQPELPFHDPSQRAVLLVWAIQAPT